MDAARIRLGRIRCLLSSIECMKKGEPLPLALCFVSNEITYGYEGTASIPILLLLLLEIQVRRLKPIKPDQYNKNKLTIYNYTCNQYNNYLAVS